MANNKTILRIDKRESPVVSETQPTRKGPIIEENLPNILKKPKNSPAFVGGVMCANTERLKV